jgi:pseudouridine synthase
MIPPTKGERLAKAIARHGICSRRDAERLIAEGQVCVNGTLIETPATLVTEADRITVKGQLLETKQPTRLWVFYKPTGVVTTHKDPQGRPTVFSLLPNDLPDHIISVGRLDLMTEGLLLLTNDGEFARKLEHPSSAIPRTYEVRVYGRLDEQKLRRLWRGVDIDGVSYGPIDCTILTQEGSNTWLEMTIKEGKNREIRNIIHYLGGHVNRLIRVAYGPYTLETLSKHDLVEVSPDLVG